MKAIDDITARLEAGLLEPAQAHDELIRAITKKDLGFDKLAETNSKYRQILESDTAAAPEFTARCIETASYIRTMWKARNGNAAAQEVLEKYHTKAALVGGTGANGGYLIPEEIEYTILELEEGASAVLEYATKFNMTRDVMKVPSLDSKLAVEWHEEGDGITESEPTFSQVTLTAYRQDAYAIASNEFLEDTSFMVTEMLLDQFAEGIAQSFDDVAFNGDGAAPASAGFSGVFTAAVSYSTVLGAGSAAFSTIMWTDLIDLATDVPSYARKRGRYFMHPDVKAFLAKRTGSDGHFIVNPFQYYELAAIYGQYPIVESHKCPSTSAPSTAFVSFGNFKYLIVGNRHGSTQMLTDPYYLASTWKTRIFMVRRRAIALGKAGAFSRLLTAA